MLVEETLDTLDHLKQFKFNTLKGIANFFFILSQVPLGIIYGGEIVETGRLDLKTTQKCKFGIF